MIRALVPTAERISVTRNGSGSVEMERRHPAGIFEAVLPGTAEIPDYRLEVLYHGGSTSEIDDPYRYGRILSDYDLYLFGEGKHTRIYEKLGAHPTTIGGSAGVHFAVWAPNAKRVSVVGDFNAWDGRRHPMRSLGGSGVWEIFIPGLYVGEKYKFEILSRYGEVVLKSDPFGFAFELPPQNASVVAAPAYDWKDAEWMRSRASADSWFHQPMAVYEVHLGSWSRIPEESGRYLTYRELAERLIPYVKEMGYSHIELLPVMEHPFSGSWGYQVIGFFAPTSRFGKPEEFKAFVDECHANGIGVILDWVPGHFPKDAHGLAQFDGTALFEHEDPRQGEHRDWGTLIFNYGRNEVRNFLLSNALFWLEEYHLDGLRVDAVASMLYLDYSRKEGEWVPNRFGGRENIEAIAFLRELNTLTHGEQPGSITVAEESTAWPSVSRPTYLGGLGFTYKWNMGWMHDTLKFTARDPLFRKWAQNEITFSMLYAYTENFILPYSHDEVVHGKRSMLDKMPGDSWQKAANLRALYAFMYAHPGKKLLFMGDEFGQWREWNNEGSLDWDLLPHFPHKELLTFVRALNRLYMSQPALFERDYDQHGFQWIDSTDHENNVIAFLRRGASAQEEIVAVFNWTPVLRESYRIGAPVAGTWQVLLNTDATDFGGSGTGPTGAIETEATRAHGMEQSFTLSLPPLGAVVLKRPPV